MRRFRAMFLAGLLALALALPAGAAQAAEAAQPARAVLSPESRQEDLDSLYAALLQHPDPFHRTPESRFQAKKAEIEARLAETDDLTFLLDLQSLIALVGDSHTSANLGQVIAQGHIYPVGLTWFDGDYVVTVLPAEEQALLGRTVRAVNGFSMAQAEEMLSALLASDNEVKLRRQVRQAFGVAEVFAYVGLTEPEGPLTLTLADENGNTEELTLEALPAGDRSGWPPLEQLRPQALPATAAQDRYYFALPLSPEAYYIQYNVCAQDPELPMETFAAQVAEALAAGDYQKVLLDLRNNGGGSDGVLQPLLGVLAPLVRRGELQVWGLIGEATFSSAAINAVMIQEMGGFLAGESASGCVDHFGELNSLRLPNSQLPVSLSRKYIALSAYLESAVGLGMTPVEPDLPLPQTLADYLAGRDTAVEAILAMEEPYVKLERGDRPLSRGRLAALLRRADGAEAERFEFVFSDLFPNNWYTPDVLWCMERGIVDGVGDRAFAPARTVTWQEAAVMAERYLTAVGRTLPVLREGEPPAGAAPWAAEAVEAAWRQGLLPEDVRPDGPMTIQDGSTLALELQK